MTSKLALGLIFGVLFAGAASAAPIATGSTINFTGSSSCDATSCTFSNVTVKGVGTGDFSGFTNGNAATFLDFTFNPFTSQQIYTATEGGQTTSFNVTSQTSMDQTSTPSPLGAILVTVVIDQGYASLTNFDDTAGVYTFTANQIGELEGSFSTTAGAVGTPEPASIALLGAGLAGLGLTRRRRRA